MLFRSKGGVVLHVTPGKLLQTASLGIVPADPDKDKLFCSGLITPSFEQF
jgi:hypothetical protein